MKKLLLVGAMVCILGMMTACKSGTASGIVDTDSVGAIKIANEADATGQQIQSVYHSVWDELENLTYKIYNGDLLVPDEWEFLFEHIDRFDGYLSEGFGNALYNTAKGNIWYNDQISSALNALPHERKEYVQGCMVGLMSIDFLCDSNQYTWLQFVEMFPMFMGSVSAEEELESINEERNNNI